MLRSLTAAVAAMASTRRLLCTKITDAVPSPTHLHALPPVTPSPTADELARLLLVPHNPFHASESSLQILSGGGVSLSQGLLVQILLRLRGAFKLAHSLLNTVRLHPSVSSPPNADAYDAVIDALGRAHQFDAAWRLVVEAATDGAATPRTFAVLARRYVAAGMTRQAVRAFDDMEVPRERARCPGVHHSTRHALQVQAPQERCYPNRDQITGGVEKIYSTAQFLATKVSV